MKPNALKAEMRMYWIFLTLWILADTHPININFFKNIYRILRRNFIYTCDQGRPYEIGGSALFLK